MSEGYVEELIVAYFNVLPQSRQRGDWKNHTILVSKKPELSFWENRNVMYE